MKKWFRRLGIALGLVMIPIAALVIYAAPPHWLREWGLPSYAKGLSPNVPEASEEFGKRVTARFTLPVPQDKVIAALIEDGFDVHPGSKRGYIERNGYPCLYRWFVSWRADDFGTVNEVRGHYGVSCLNERGSSR